MNKRIDFSTWPLNRETRRRLAAIEDSRFQHSRQKTALADKLLVNSLDVQRGLFVPLTSHVRAAERVPARLHTQCSAKQGFPFPLFRNASSIPQGEAGAVAVSPTLRAANAGYVVVTIEHDPDSVEGVEEAIDWTVAHGKIFRIDDELSAYKDYAGFSAVFSGHKSVHHHFLFSTSHLSFAPYDAPASERWQHHKEYAAVMAAAHKRYFDAVHSLSELILETNMKADLSMRSYTQWRRAPWGTRILDRDSKIFSKLKAGAVLPQLVLSEKIRSDRAPKGSRTFLVPPDIQGDLIITNDAAQASNQAGHVGRGPQLRAELQLMCRTEWKQEYPKPVGMRRDGQHWVINFQNHSTDRNPSTVCRGNHNALLIQGTGAPQGSFVLPGELTANEMGDHLALRFGLISPVASAASASNPPRAGGSRFDRLKRKSGRSLKQYYEAAARDNFPIRSTDNVQDLQEQYRRKLGATSADCRSFHCDAITESAEGIGKTQALFGLMAEEALDTALTDTDGITRFSNVAFRSDAQTMAKAKEYRELTGRACFVWRSVWSHYTDVCRLLQRKPIPKAEFEEESNIAAVLDQIRREQRPVFERLEEVRRALWANGDGRSLFNPNTVLFTTHATVMTWFVGRMTRIWHHPAFDLSMTDDEMETLRKQAVLQDIVIDEPEFDELIWLVSAELYAHLASVKSWDWKRRAVKERRDLFESIRRSGAIPTDMTFEEYNELRYLDLATLQRVEVDFWSQPFGRESTAQSIYRACHQRPFYLGAKAWPFAGSARITFLTTEAFTTEAISAVYAKAREPLLRLQLDQLPGLYPVNVPVVKDRRARAKEKDIQALVREILNTNANAVVIADGLGELKGDRAMTFQGMKGHNGLSEKDVYIIPTFLAPEVYARLNVLGQWTGQQDIVAKYYAAQISQAVGRNTGFRLKPGTKTTVVISDRLLRLIGPALKKLDIRFSLLPTPDRMW